jgi:PTS system nitrogen regulatory IIA component
MDLIEIIPPEGVLIGLRASSKKHALMELASLAARFTGVPEKRLLEGLLERERLGSTGIGNGVAVPHTKVPEINRLWGFFARLDHRINFDSIDEQPVDLIFLLLTPTAAGAEHLKALARVSRLLRSHSACEKLRGADDASALYAILTQPMAATAA